MIMTPVATEVHYGVTNDLIDPLGSCRTDRTAAHGLTASSAAVHLQFVSVFLFQSVQLV